MISEYCLRMINVSGVCYTKFGQTFSYPVWIITILILIIICLMFMQKLSDQIKELEKIESTNEGEGKNE